MKKKIKSKIDLAFIRNRKPTLDQLIKALEREAISVVLRQNDEGRIYGITYVDHLQKVVFNGSDLGKPYSANAIQERCGMVPPGHKIPVNKNTGITPEPTGTVTDNNLQESTSAPVVGGLADALLQQEFTGETLPYELRTTKRRSGNALTITNDL